MRKGFLSLWFAVGALLAFIIALAQTQANPAKIFGSKKQKVDLPKFVPGEVVVKLKKPVDNANAPVQMHSLLQSVGQSYPVSILSLKTDQTLVRMKTEDQDVPMEALLSKIQSHESVDFAEPNFIYYASTIHKRPLAISHSPNDPMMALTWGMFNLGQVIKKQPGVMNADIGATHAWGAGYKGSKDIVVAVIDTGVDYTHPDLKDNIYINTKEIADNGIDDDQNGFIDDIHGWNFEGKNNNPMDDNEHGTHTSGTIGATGNNGVGVAGVNWDVSIMPLKFLSKDGSGTLADAVEAIKYATKMNVNIMSNSWGGGGYSKSMKQAIEESKKKNILFVAAAGNEANDNDADPSYPASYEVDNVVSVAATDNRDEIATFSNYGRHSVHLAAPGVAILSTVPIKKDKNGKQTNEGYEMFSGTSMATPHVAGAAALIWSANLSADYREVKGRLLSSVEKVKNLKRKTRTGGRLNVYRAIKGFASKSEAEPDEKLWKKVEKREENQHPYASSAVENYVISHPGAKMIRLRFKKISTENGYDLLVIRDSAGDLIDRLSGRYTDYVTQAIDGDKVDLSLISDSSGEEFGFVIEGYDFID